MVNNIEENYSETLMKIDLALVQAYCREENFEEAIKICEKFYLLDKNNPDSKNSLIVTIKNYALKLFEKKEYIKVLLQLKKIEELNSLDDQTYFLLAKTFDAIDLIDLALEFYLKAYGLNNKDINLIKSIGDIYLKKENYDLAIKYYKEYIAIDQNNADIFNKLGHLYFTCFPDNKYIDIALDYFNTAYKLNPTSHLIVKNLIIINDRLFNKEKVFEYYRILFNLKPTPMDYADYGAYCIRNLNFIEGYKYLKSRFFLEDNAYLKVFNVNNMWDGIQDIKDKTLLVHYEQGYGDSIMYIRFIHQLKSFCKKLIVIVQDELLDLFKDSNLDLDFRSNKELYSINYDYHLPLMEVANIIKLLPEKIIKKDGYLSVPDSKINEYKDKYFRTKKLKIGISYKGSPALKELQRDIPLKNLLLLSKIDDVQIYSFQTETDIDNLKDFESSNIINIRNTFKNFQDTAAALKCLDLFITTDNVLLNLAGALGVKTFALFNNYIDYRWFNFDQNNVGWYNSVKPFRAKSMNYWDDVVNEIYEEIRNIIKNK